MNHHRTNDGTLDSAPHYTGGTSDLARGVRSTKLSVKLLSSPHLSHITDTQVVSSQVHYRSIRTETNYHAPYIVLQVFTNSIWRGDGNLG